MQGRKEFIPQLFYELSLDRLVTSDNFYRRVNQVLDLHFLYKSSQKYYGTQNQVLYLLQGKNLVFVNLFKTSVITSI